MFTEEFIYLLDEFIFYLCFFNVLIDASFTFHIPIFTSERVSFTFLLLPPYTSFTLQLMLY